MRRFLAMLLVVLVTSGCGTTVSNLKYGQSLKTEASEGVVLGRFNFNLNRGSAYVVHFKDLETKKSYSIAVQDKWTIFNKKAPNKLNHELCIALPAGSYQIYRIQMMFGADTVDSQHMIDFTVEAGKTTYIGTLTYEWEQTKDYLLWGRGNVYVDVLDEHEEEERLQGEFCPMSKSGEYRIDLLKVLK